MSLASSPTSRRAPLRRLTGIVYGTLLLLSLAMPQQIADRLDDFEPNAVAHAGKVTAEALAQIMARTGLPQLFVEARGAFLAAAGERH